MVLWVVVLLMLVVALALLVLVLLVLLLMLLLLCFLEFWRIGWIGVVVGGAAAVGSGFGFAGVVGAAVLVLSSFLCFLASLFLVFVAGWVECCW